MADKELKTKAITYIKNRLDSLRKERDILNNLIAIQECILDELE